MEPRFLTCKRKERIGTCCNTDRISGIEGPRDSINIRPCTTADLLFTCFRRCFVAVTHILTRAERITRVGPVCECNTPTNSVSPRSTICRQSRSNKQSTNQRTSCIEIGAHHQRSRGRCPSQGIPVSKSILPCVCHAGFSAFVSLFWGSKTTAHMRHSCS